MISLEYIKERLDYRPDAGIFLWKTRPVKRGEDVRWNGRHAGKVAGSVNGNGYIKITIDAKCYEGQRLAWIYEYGEWPKGQIDHINRDRTDNRIDNLRDVTKTQNSWNQSVSRHSTTGLRGVWRMADCDRWRAAIRVHGKRKHLGVFKTPLEASDAYKRAAVEFFGEFAGVGG